MSWEHLAPKSSNFEEQLCTIDRQNKNQEKDIKKVIKRLKSIKNNWLQEVKLLSTLVRSACNLYHRLNKTNDKTLGILVHFPMIEQRLSWKQNKQWILIINTLHDRFLQLKQLMKDLENLKHELFNVVETDKLSHLHLFHTSSFDVAPISDILLEITNIYLLCHNDLTNRSLILAQILNENIETNTLMKWDKCNSSIVESFQHLTNTILNEVPSYINSNLLM